MLNVYGVGLLTPWGQGESVFFDALNRAEPVEDSFDEVNPVRYLTVDSYVPSDHFDEKQLHNLDRNSTLVIGVAKFAFENARHEWGESGQGAVGVVVGSAHSIATSMSDFEESVLRDGIRRSRIGIFPNTVMCAPASRVSIVEKIKGANTTVASGLNSGLDAIGCAKLAIENEVVGLMLVGGADAFSEKIWQGLKQEGVIWEAKGKKPRKALFKNKFVPVESACALLIGKDNQFKAAHSSQVRCQIAAYANSFSVCKKRDVAERAINLRDLISLALSQAKVEFSDIDFVIASGYFDENLTRVEGEALSLMSFPNTMPILRPKAFIGETFAAQGLMSVVIAIGIMDEKICSESIRSMTLRAKEPGGCIEKDRNWGLILQLDPSGHNSVVIVKKAKVENG